MAYELAVEESLGGTAVPMIGGRGVGGYYNLQYINELGRSSHAQHTGNRHIDLLGHEAEQRVDLIMDSEAFIQAPERPICMLHAHLCPRCPKCPDKNRKTHPRFTVVRMILADFRCRILYTIMAVSFPLSECRQ